MPATLVLATLLAVFLTTLPAPAVMAQADQQAEERSRFDLGRLADGPAIVGAGLIIGEPSGLTAKLWFTETGFAADAAVAWSFAENPGLYMHVNALFHLAIIETAGGRYLAPYLGGGLSYRIGSENRLGLRVPLGLSILPFSDLPIEFFGELAPGIGLLPDTAPSFGAGLGARFYLPF